MILIVGIMIFNSNVDAIGVSPARKTIDFSPGYKETVTFNVLNNEHKDMKVIIYVEGDLNESIKLSETLLEFKANENNKEVNYEITLPTKLTEPGTHENKIVVREIPDKQAGEGALVSASAAVIHQLQVLVPYPGKYAKASLTIAETTKGQPLSFLLTVRNLGTQDIVRAKGVIDIYGANNEKIAMIQTDEKGIKSKQRDDLVAGLDVKGWNPGKYYAKATIIYDGDTTTTESTFSLGDFYIEILDINVKDFKLGQIARFNILIDNKWGEQIKDVYAEMIINDKNGDEITRFKSANEDVNGNSKEELTAFWDTAGVKEGTYTGKITVYYQGKQTEKELRAAITLNAIKVDLIGITAEAVNLSSGRDNTMIIVLVVVLISVNVGWFVYFKRKEKIKAQTQGNREQK